MQWGGHQGPPHFCTKEKRDDHEDVIQLGFGPFKSAAVQARQKRSRFAASIYLTGIAGPIEVVNFDPE